MIRRPYKVVWTLASVLVIAILAITGLRWEEEHAYEKEGAALIAHIEAFRATHARLPHTVLELDLEEAEDQGPYYEKQDSTTYRISFFIGFDHAYTYSSSTKLWKNVP